MNIVVDVAYKFNRFNDEFGDKLYTLLKIVVELKLLIDNIEFILNLFKVLRTVVEVGFHLLIVNVELYEKLRKSLNVLVDVEFKLLKFVFVACIVKFGLLNFICYCIII